MPKKATEASDKQQQDGGGKRGRSSSMKESSGSVAQEAPQMKKGKTGKKEATAMEVQGVRVQPKREQPKREQPKREQPKREQKAPAQIIKTRTKKSARRPTVKKRIADGIENIKKMEPISIPPPPSPEEVKKLFRSSSKRSSSYEGVEKQEPKVAELEDLAGKMRALNLKHPSPRFGGLIQRNKGAQKLYKEYNEELANYKDAITVASNLSLQTAIDTIGQKLNSINVATDVKKKQDILNLIIKEDIKTLITAKNKLEELEVESLVENFEVTRNLLIKTYIAESALLDSVIADCQLKVASNTKGSPIHDYYSAVITKILKPMKDEVKEELQIATEEIESIDLPIKSVPSTYVTIIELLTKYEAINTELTTKKTERKQQVSNIEQLFSGFKF